MKTFNTTIAIAALVAVSLTSCRKGEDDPFLSFRSRDARITGEFEVNQRIKVSQLVSEDSESGSVVGETSFNNSSFSSSFAMTDATVVGVTESVLLNAALLANGTSGLSVGNEYQSTYSGKSTASLTIEKDGTYNFDYKFTITALVSNGSQTDLDPALIISGSESGRWNWDNSKKNKSGITFVSDLNNAYLNGTFQISQLKEKEIVMSKASKTKQTTSEDGSTYTTSTDAVTSITLTKKDK